ncbi:MAG: hypothetical protein KF805_12600 [Phycisphaeraceae bacterium]|nr:hypothetical protein [Phycisphaeraceae bacterium]
MSENENKWTTEPWRYNPDERNFEQPFNWIYKRPELGGQGFIMSAADFDRACACVNACAGMADPAKEIERLRADVAALEAELTRLRAVETAADAMREYAERYADLCDCDPDTYPPAMTAVAAYDAAKQAERGNGVTSQ